MNICSGKESLQPQMKRREIGVEIMGNTIVTLKKGEGRMLKSGGLWIFDNEIASILGEL